MSRYTIHRKDSTHDAIRAALEAAGWQVFVRMPCDMFCYKNGVWRALEAKPPKDKAGNPRIRSTQARQSAFLALTATPVCVTPEAALMALGSIGERNG